MLNAHPEIAFVPETHFLRKYIFTKKILGSRYEAIELLKEDKELKRIGIDLEILVEGTNSFQDLYTNLLDQYLELKKKSIIGDKDPRNIDFLNELKSCFPNDKIIHIIRDPRDVVLSRTKAAWSKKWPFWMHVFMYKAQLKRGRDKGKLLYNSNYYEITYEELISNPETVLIKLCDFIEVEFNSKMLSFSNSAKELIDSSEMQWKKETIGPLLSDNKEKWKNELKDKQIGLIQSICYYAFNNFPYEMKTVRLNLIDRIFVSFMKLPALLFSLLYPIRIKFLKK